MGGADDGVAGWSQDLVEAWFRDNMLSEAWVQVRYIDGAQLLAITEQDFYHYPFDHISFPVRKSFRVKLKLLQKENRQTMIKMGLLDATPSPASTPGYEMARNGVESQDQINDFENEHNSRPASEDGRASRLKPEVWKAFLSLCYVFLVTWVTAVVMVIVHDKVPDMKKYPPLPDLFLDNVPHIPWAFDICEITGTVLMAIWMGVLLFHKHRFILLRRFFALSGTVFLLRCITMLITSLSVPGGHLKCAPRHYPSDVEMYSNWSRRLTQAYAIWTGAGMSVRGVRTCGDYMFSGHTVTLTLLNFFITEYTSRSLYLLHIVTWLMNMFGIFFILAAHEHYSIDVFIAFYITSRLFLYYHTLSNNQALMQGDSLRTRIWFPLLSFFESEVDGIVPNEYESPLSFIGFLRNKLRQKCQDFSETSLIRFVGNSLNQQAAMVDFSVARMLDNLKRNLNNNHRPDIAPDSLSTPCDKNVQMPAQSETNKLPNISDSTCNKRSERVESTDSKKVK